MRLLVLALLAALLLTAAAGPRAVQAQVLAKSLPVVYKTAPSCAFWGSYGASECCCAPGDKNPLYRTVTVIKRMTVTARKAVGASRRAYEEAATTVDEHLLPETDEADHLQARNARHLCPRCPAKVLLSSKNNGQNARVIFCCPARKTIIKKRTTTKIITKTATSAPKATIRGVLYYDNDKNGDYNPGIDDLITNTVVALVYGAKHKRAVGDVLAKTTTNNKGEFQINFDKQMPGINLEVTKDSERNTPLLQFVTDNTGNANVDVPLLRPNTTTAFTVTPAILTPGFAAKVSGTGQPGYRTFLYSDGVRVGETVILPNQSYVVVSAKRLISGKHKITATMADDKAAETSSLDCGSLTVVGTPIIPNPAVLTADNKAKVTGTATPGALIKMYNDGVYAGQVVCGADGNFTVTSTAALSAKTHQITVSQTPTGEPESAQESCGALTPFTIKPATLLSDHNGQALGTGTPGAIIKFYDNGALVGSTTVATDGTFTVTTTKGLGQGTHPMTATQTISGKPESSPPLSAGTLTVSGDPLIADPAVLTSDNKAKVTGTATPGAVIKIYDDGVYAGQAVCAGDGKFTVTSNAALSAKTHAITVSQTPTGQSESSPVDCGPLTPFTVKPAILLADKKGSANGTGTPGATIKLYSDAAYAGTATVAADGTYVVVTSAALVKGTHAMTVTQTISGGTESAPPLSAGPLIVPGIPLVPNPAVFSPSKEAVVNGTGSPNAPIKIYVDGNPAGTGTIGSDGKFTITSLNPLTPGTHAITVSQVVDSIEEAQVSAGSLTVISGATTTAVSGSGGTTTNAGATTTAVLGGGPTTFAATSTAPAKSTTKERSTTTVKSSSLTATTTALSTTVPETTTTQPHITTSTRSTSTRVTSTSMSKTSSQSRTKSSTETKTSSSKTPFTTLTKTSTTSFTPTPKACNIFGMTKTWVRFQAQATVTITAVGAGGGAGGNALVGGTYQNGGAGGGGGLSAAYYWNDTLAAPGDLVLEAQGGNGGAAGTGVVNPGGNGSRAYIVKVFERGEVLVVDAGGGGGAGAVNVSVSWQPGGGGGYGLNGGGGGAANNDTVDTNGGGGGTWLSGGQGGGNAVNGASGVGGRGSGGIPYGGFGGSVNTAGLGFWGGGGGSAGGGGGAAGRNGGQGLTATNTTYGPAGGLGSNTYLIAGNQNASLNIEIPENAGLGGQNSGDGGNAGIVMAFYWSPTGVCLLNYGGPPPPL